MLNLAVRNTAKLIREKSKSENIVLNLVLTFGPVSNLTCILFNSVLIGDVISK